MLLAEMPICDGVTSRQPQKMLYELFTDHFIVFITYTVRRWVALVGNLLVVGSTVDSDSKIHFGTRVVKNDLQR